MRLRPTFTVSSPRPVWRQVVQGLAIFAIGTIVLLAGSIGVAAAKGAWDRHQDAQRWHAELASQGIAEVCHRGVSQHCAQEGASKSKIEVAYIDDSYGYLWVSIGTQDFKAYDVGLVGTLWSQPRLAADRSKQFRFARTVVIDGVGVTLWTSVPSHHCGCPRATTATTLRPTAAAPHKPLIARATWTHDSHLYELATFFGDNPTATLTKTFKTIRYVAPSG